MPKTRMTNQRRIILEELRRVDTHPTVDELYTIVKARMPHISLGTVYRNLSLLSDLGEIMKITTDGGADRFDGNTNRHHHFICTRCHRVMDLDMPNIDEIMEKAQKCCTGQIQNYVTHFYGICGDCIEKS